MKRLIIASAMSIGMLGAATGVASASKFGPNPFGAGNSPACQPGHGNGDVHHIHTGPPGQPGNPSARDIHNLDLQNGNSGNCAQTPPKPPTPPPAPPKPPGPPTPPRPSVVPGHGPVSPTAAVGVQHAAVVTPQHVSQQQAVQQHVTVAPAAAPVQTTAHFTG